MTYYADLGPCGRHSVRDYELVAVGWLDTAAVGFAGFPKGEVPNGLVEKLLGLASVRQANLFQGAGFHSCNLDQCPSPKPAVAGTRLGRLEIFVPVLGNPRQVFCCPDLVIHYISAHSYRPPDEFVRSALAAAPQSVPQLTDVSMPDGELPPPPRRR